MGPHNIYKAIGTLGGVGYLPKAPGTWGSFFAMIIWYCLFCYSDFGTWHHQVLLILLMGLLGIFATNKLEILWGKDPSKIVIDEAVGIWIALACVPCNWSYLLSVFLLFRLLDIFKPLGIKRCESISGGLGVMLDDVLAGIYTGAVLFSINHWMIDR